MHVVIIGCGLAGVTTAYFLHRSGASVTVIDREPAPAAGASHANGALLTPSLADPWNAPGVLRRLIRSIGRADAPLLLHPGQLPSLGGWSLKFLLNARRARFHESYLHNVHLARYSQTILAEIRAHTGIEFDYADDGILQLFEDPRAFEAALKAAHWLQQAGIAHEALSVDRLLTLEPALAATQERLAGAIRYPDDAVGDARRFCEALAGWLAEAGVTFRFGQQVLGFAAEGNRVLAAQLPTGALRADAFVLAAGSYSRPLAKLLGLQVPVVPAKGYSITVPITEGAPRWPVTHAGLHAVLVPLGGERLRVAGTAEFAGFDTSIRPERIRNLFALLRRLYPQIEVDADKLEPWSGLRPLSPDGRPLLGASKLGNLFLNTGHGALGWTLAAASGKVVAELVGGAAPSHDPAPFRPDRF